MGFRLYFNHYFELLFFHAAEKYSPLSARQFFTRSDDAAKGREEDDAKVVRIESCDSKKYFTYDSLTRDCVLLISLEGFSTPFLKVSKMIILI